MTGRHAPLSLVQGERGSPHNLPARLTSIIGREREMSEMGRLLGSTRLLSLVGSGGSGKTRLAIEYAAVVGDFPDGAWLVELAPLTEGSLVIPAIADVFEIREQPGVHLFDSVIAHLVDRRLLIVLDNCEHLVEVCAEVVHGILASCPEARILTTSREPLHDPGEVVLRVPPLALPDPGRPADPGTLEGFDSVRLFTERARAASPGFALTPENAQHVALLCYHLDGLPLAIELAASRVGLFPVSTIVERLDDRFRLLVGGSRTALSRQQTLHATLDWSYNLLDDDERALLQALSMFVGGIALDAAEGTCAPEEQGADVIGLLGQLVDKSLVMLDEGGAEPRYRLLESVREYGQERLVESGDRDAVERRHAEWFHALGERGVRALPRPDRGGWLTRLEAEHDNIRVAIERSLVADPERALRIGGAMWPFWLWRAYLAEGIRWLDLALARAPGRTELQAGALLGAGVLTIRSGGPREGIALAERALEIYRELGDQRSLCRALHSIAPPTFGQDDLPGAERLYRESLDLAARAGYEPGRAAAMQGLGVIRWYRGHREEAEALLQESLSLFRSRGEDPELAPPLLDVGEFLVLEPETGSLRMVFQEAFSSFQDVPCRTAVGDVLANLGMIARGEGEHERARASLEKALSVFEDLGDERAIGHALGRLGNLATAEGDYERASGLLERSVEIRRRIRDWRGMALAESNLGNLATAQGNLDGAGALLEATAETFRRRGDRWGYAGTLGNLASLALARGDRAEARRLIEKGLVIIDEIGISRWRGWALLQLGALARLQGEEGRAEDHVREALATFQRIEDVRGVEHALAFLSRSTQRGLATVLFGDIVGSTATATDLGNRGWRDLLEGFHGMVRDKLGDFGGREVDTAGDGFLAVFEGPGQAIACAAAVGRAARQLGIEMRAGIHTGEIERVGDAVRGIAVHIGARVSAQAAPGEIMVTRTVRDLLLGSAVELETRGTHTLKGVPGEWELFAVANDGAS
ncbi:MAG TPA: tetratricopeptide repeat protein [Actinomycetota bacterium]|nr:tetratricopeptide repeat protein [Actinomycetota bacterium]